MQEQIILFKTARLAKEKGFFEWSPKRYKDGKLTYSPCLKYAKTGLVKPDQNQIFAPTQSILQKWLREKHNIHIEINSITTLTNGYYIILRGIGFELNLDNDSQGNYYPILENLGYKVFSSYEEALEAGLFEALKLINVE